MLDILVRRLTIVSDKLMLFILILRRFHEKLNKSSAFRHDYEY
ncbi:hypothetical protein HMPREF0620_1524 [Parascardovia denticolens DSM 10105 = JCM 12538]|uniref:Uncharacterized protein n=1 Tax=Parascardovia denticolens DSM 10105 = JCM 12538 TaxID=864564 RepID=E6K251_PARDN|nr:hypothetical protein HMPREF0620_1524 [Parascardovia denticolens DSM 10105 = JCM 12538]